MKFGCVALFLSLSACAADAPAVADCCGPADTATTDAATDAIVPEAVADSASDAAVDSAPDATSADAWPSFGCTPGNDKTCNWLPQGIGLAGHCDADGTCTCNPGIGLEETTGKCVDMSWCDPHFVDSCHGNDSTTEIAGVCQPNGTCVCNPGFALDANGRCTSTVCHGGCPTEGITRCAGGFLQTCDGPANGCAHHWFTTDNCHLETCNADATKCVPVATTTCTVSGDCPCGCGCSSGKCLCTGAIPPTCSHDSDCGPACKGLICTAGSCVAAGAHP